MITFAQYLEESLSHAYPVHCKYDSFGVTTCVFTDEKSVVYTVTISTYRRTATVEFDSKKSNERYPSMDIDGKTAQSALRVYATVWTAIKHHLAKDRGIHRIKFTNAIARSAPLYEKLAKRIAIELDGTLTVYRDFEGVDLNLYTIMFLPRNRD